MAATLIESASDLTSAINHIHMRLDSHDVAGRDSGQRTETEFDPNEYFSVFRHISLPKGFVLDYFYEKSDTIGNPMLYVRRESESPVTSWPVHFLLRDKDDRNPNVRPVSPENLLLPDGTPESWFELVAFSALAGQFYLFWHANSDDFEFLTTDERLAVIATGCELSDTLKAAALAMEASVVVDIQEQVVDVTYTSFSKWGGFKRQVTRLNRRFPYRTIGENVVINEVPYDCGIRY